MSRTKHNSKKPGYDYWTARPGNHGSQGYGPDVKKHTHRLERIEDKKEIKKQLDD